MVSKSIEYWVDPFEGTRKYNTLPGTKQLEEQGVCVVLYFESPRVNPRIQCYVAITKSGIGFSVSSFGFGDEMIGIEYFLVYSLSPCLSHGERSIE